MFNKFNQIKSEFKTTENLILRNFERSELLKNHISKYGLITSQGNDEKRVLFKTLKSLNEFKRLIHLDDFGGDFIKSNKGRFYELFFEDNGSHKISFDLNKSLNFKKTKSSCYSIDCKSVKVIF